MDIKLILSITGWIGTFFYVLAYFLLTVKVISSSSFKYHFLNIVGASGLIINAFHFKDHANIMVNGVWLVIASIAVVVLLSKQLKVSRALKEKA